MIEEPPISKVHFSNTLPKTYMDPDCLARWKSVFLYQPVVFRVHGIVFQGVRSAFPIRPSGHVRPNPKSLRDLGGAVLVHQEQALF